MALRFLRSLTGRLARRPAPQAHPGPARPPGARRPDPDGRTAPAWVEDLDEGQRARLARNLRRIVEPRQALESEIRAAR